MFNIHNTFGQSQVFLILGNAFVEIVVKCNDLCVIRIKYKAIDFMCFQC